MKNGKEIRTCIGCREKRKKQELIRIVKSNDNVIVDLKQDIKTRGTYICNDERCFEKVMKKKALNRAFKMNISDAKYQEIRGVIFGGRK